MARKRIAMLVIAFVVVCSIATSMAVVGTRVTTLATSLGSLIKFSATIQKDVKAADLEAVATDLVELDDLTQDLLIAASDPILSASLNGIPFVGPHLQAARTIASAAAGVTAAAAPLSRVLPLLEPRVLVIDGRYNVETLEDLDVIMKNLADQLSIANTKIGSIDLDGMDRRFVSAVDEIAPTLIGAETLLGQIEPLVGILPIVLSDEGNRTWFVALQNLTEARATGGIFGSYAVLNINDGVVKMTATGSDQDLVPIVPPLGGVPNSFVDLWGANIDDWRSINVSPHFPYTGRMVANQWEAYSGEKVDGVLAFGQGIVQYMLAASGPITVDGTTIDASTVIDFLSLGVYEKYPNVTDKNAFVSDLVAELFLRLQTGSFDIESLLSATGTTPTDDRLLAWATKRETEQKIIDSGYGGMISTEYGPTALLAINNGGGNKLEQFLHVSVEYSLGACSKDASENSRAATMTITLTNSAPPSGLPPYVSPREDYADTLESKPVGSNLEIVSVYLPVGAEEGDTTIDGDAEFGYVGVERGRTVLAFDVDLNPRETKTLVVPWTEPTVGEAVVDMLGAKQTVVTQPSLNPIVVKTPAASTCP
jgi:hypothetical protein